jgi:predicted metal-dependent hydrolase
MSKKSAKIAALIDACRGKDLPAHYLGYFECFNRQLFYEAHDVLEELWLAKGKQGANYGFYKGLIQFAGAFVHLQKDRLRPAAALFKLSRSYLEKFPARHQQLDVAHLLSLATEWIGFLEAAGFLENPLLKTAPPVLELSG